MVGQASNKQSDRDAVVGELHGRYFAALLRYFRRRGIDRQDAQDLTQEVFVRLSGNSELDRVTRVDGYLFATASNLAMDFFRRGKVRGDYIKQAHHEAILATTDFSTEQLAEGREELAHVVGLLNEMPERMRNIFILARLEDIPRAEIAARLGVSKSLVEQQLKLATACLSAARWRSRK